MLEATPAIVTTSRKTRSKVRNRNSLFVDEIDGRSREYRRFRDVLAQLESDMGGDPSEAQTAIARNAAALAVWCERQQATLAGGGNIDIAEYTTATNALRRLLCDLGLERRARDVTTDLRSYLETRNRAPAQGHNQGD